MRENPSSCYPRGHSSDSNQQRIRPHSCRPSRRLQGAKAEKRDSVLQVGIPRILLTSLCTGEYKVADNQEVIDRALWWEHISVRLWITPGDPLIIQREPLTFHLALRQLVGSGEALPLTNRSL